MADDVTIHNGAAGTGTSFDAATDDDGSGNHVQLIKLVQSANGSRTAIDADSGGLLVNLGANNDVTVTRSIVRVTATPTISTSAYAVKDAVGGLLTFANAAATSGGAICVRKVIVTDNALQSKYLDLVLFRDSITAPTDNAIFDPTDTELESLIDRVPVTGGAYSDFSDNAVASVDCEVYGTLAATSLYGVLVARDTPTYATTSDIDVILIIEQF